MTTEYYCAGCGKKLLENERPCSSCGCSARKITHEIHDTIGISDNFLRAKVKNPNIPGTAYEMTKKKKHSGETKQPAQEIIIIDRTCPEKTIKKHRVKELDGQKWKTVHDEHEEYPAKHRKKRMREEKHEL